MILFVTGYI